MLVLRVRELLAGRVEKVETPRKQIENNGK